MLDSCSQRIVILFLYEFIRLGEKINGCGNLTQYLERVPLRAQTPLNLSDMI
jgi:hypothetical protein